MSDSNSKDRAIGRIGFQFVVNGKAQWATGEYESFLQENEDVNDLMARVEENALQIAFDIRDGLATQLVNETKQRRTEK